jgi:dihydropteroate synthase
MRINGAEFQWGKRTYIMGILNRTPDSFSDGGRYTGLDEALAHVAEMLREGADIIDIGGESTRPGFTPVGADEEIERVVPLIEAATKKHGATVSVDTYHAATAEAAVKAGAHILNDIWGLKADPEMAGVAARHGVPVCIMHNKETPEYENLIEDMIRELEESVEIAVKSGVRRENIIIDPGVGFGKTYQHNIEVMRNLERFKGMGYPVLLGVSRKSMIGLTLDLPVGERLEGTIAANVIGIMKGADIIRVHDVERNRRAASMADRVVR